MQKENLQQIVFKLMTRGKGILAADESNGTADKRLEAIGAKTGEKMRQKYRDLFLSTSNIGHYISGVILYDETLRQRNLAGEYFVDHLEDEGIIPGIKVDTGAKDHNDFPGEKITDGLKDLDQRLKEYYQIGARFTKWRAAIRIDESNDFPTKGAVLENAIRFAKYVVMVQKNNMVPIVEPEVLLEGDHSIEKAEEIISKTLKIVFEQIKEAGADLSGLILKTSMAVPGNHSGEEMNSKDVAKRTVKVLTESVPKEVGGIVFLSGGQTPEEARDNLNEIANLEPLPWEIAFSYARAIQGPALEIWKGKDENVEKAREEFLKWLVFDTKADRGELDDDLEY